MSHVHVVEEGECLIRIAAKYGFNDYRMIYDHPSNANFKLKRPNPNLIFPGDKISIPEKTHKVHRAQTGQVHTFVVTVQKRKLRLALEDVDRKRMAGVPCVIELGGRHLEKATDGEGILELTIDANAEVGTVTAGGHEWPIRVGHLNPVEQTNDDGTSGLKARLRNMGFDPGSSDLENRSAVRAFQLTYGLKDTGEFDADTRRTIVDKHGT